MGEVITIGLDIAKSVFQVHGVDEAGAVTLRKRIGRAKMLEFFGKLTPCLSASKRVLRRITGAASCRHLATR